MTRRALSSPGAGIRPPRVSPSSPLRLSPSSFLLILLLGLFSFPSAAQPYTRTVDAFPVLGADGAPYTHPLLGGFNVPRPQFRDIDADGDLDLFVQERPGQVMFFENTGTPAAWHFTWRTDAYASLNVGEWVRFADLDADGDLDALAEEPFNLLRYYRNTGTPAEARFELAAAPLTASANGGDARIFSDRQNIPALADIDCDGLPDLFIPALDGTVAYYANQGIDEDGVPAFHLVTDRWQGIEIIGIFGGKTKTDRHGAASIAFADVDLDGDLDLFWGDFFSPSLYFLENTGSCTEPHLERTSDVFPLAHPLMTSGYNAPAFADINANGQPDLFVGVLGGAFGGGPYAGRNVYFFEHQGDLDFVLRTRQFISSLDVGQESAPAFADFDGDGDLDLLVGNRIDPVTSARGQLFYFENTGTSKAPVFQLVTESLVDVGERFNVTPAVADLDADGDLDLLIGGFDGRLAYFRNEGTPHASAFLEVDSSVIGGMIDVGQSSAPALADIDGDGDLDLFVGESAGTINFFRNTGTAQQPAFTLETEPFAAIDIGQRSMPAFHDVEGDGDLDLIVGSQQNELALYRNTGTARQPAFATAEPFDVPAPPLRTAAPAFTDVDADGDTDVFAGAETGGLFYFRNDHVSTALETLPKTSSGLQLRLAYPNPFRVSTTFLFLLDRPGRVRLTVYDMLGRAVAVPIDEVRQVGRQEVVFEASALPAGVYLYTLTTEHGEQASGRLVRVR